MSLYLFSVIVYAGFFCKFGFILELIMGTFSFLFHGPTYLIILNVYALCRIDDISWGTKGLDANSSGGKTEKLK